VSWYSSEQEKHQDPWSSIVDLMSAFALVLFLAVTFFIINYNRASEKLKQRQIQLKTKQQQLQVKTLALKNKNTALQEKTLSLATVRKAKKELEIERSKLRLKNDAIQKRVALLEDSERKNKIERDSLIAERKRLLAEQQKLLQDKQALATELGKKAVLMQKIKLNKEEQQRILLATKVSQEKCETKLKTMIRDRKNVLDAIARAFSISKQQKQVSFDAKTGKFRLKGEILFQEGKSTLSASGKKYLGGVLKALNHAVLNPKSRKAISGIMVEGHTSSTGKAHKNWKLSTQRSLAALQYLLLLAQQKYPRYIGVYKRLLFAAGFGQYRPVRDRNGRPNSKKSRRIEIQVLFKQNKQIRAILRK